VNDQLGAVVTTYNLSEFNRFGLRFNVFAARDEPRLITLHPPFTPAIT
jgi:hypothetical protein